MRPFASYEITLRGTLLDVKEAIDCIADAVRDQHDALPNLFDKYSPNVDDDDDDNVVPSDIEETIAIWQTHDCVWLEDLEALAADIASFAPNLIFSISGHIEDPSDSAEDEMDFKICYNNKKLLSQSTDWYWCIHMDDFPDYNTFCSKVCDLYGNPRYSEEDYLGFRASADEWYILDGGHGEFSTEAPLQDPVRIKIKPIRR